MVNIDRNFLIMVNNLPQIYLKLLQKEQCFKKSNASKRAIQKSAEATGDLFGNKIAHKITKISKTSKQNISKSVKNEHDKEIPEERYISPEERQKVIDDLRLV